MTETLDTANAIQSILYKIDAIEGTQLLLLQGEADKVLEMILPLFDENPNLDEVYFRVDNTSQTEVVASLKSDGLRVSQPVVSRRMTLLLEHGLIEQMDGGVKGAKFAKKRVVEKALRLSARLRQRKLKGK